MKYMLGPVLSSLIALTACHNNGSQLSTDDRPAPGLAVHVGDRKIFGDDFPFDVDSLVASNANTFWLAHLASLMYGGSEDESFDDFEDTVRSELLRWGFRHDGADSENRIIIREYSVEDGSIFDSNKVDTQWAWIETPDAVFISFGGSESFIDFMTDLRAGFAKLKFRNDDLGLVHTGFFHALAPVWGDIETLAAQTYQRQFDAAERKKADGEQHLHPLEIIQARKFLNIMAMLRKGRDYIEEDPQAEFGLDLASSLDRQVYWQMSDAEKEEILVQWARTLGDVVDPNHRSNDIADQNRIIEDNDLLSSFYPRKPIFVTGHSLGGALAKIVALYLMKTGHDVRGAYTFGAPRIGDYRLKHIFQSIAFENSAREGMQVFINNNDAIPRIPHILANLSMSLSKAFGEDGSIQPYLHIGRFNYLTEGGKIIRCADEHEFKETSKVFMDAASAPGRVLRSIADIESGSLTGFARSMVNDHYMSRYIPKIEALMTGEDPEAELGCVEDPN